jgi:hypothetical protein
MLVWPRARDDDSGKRIEWRSPLIAVKLVTVGAIDLHAKRPRAAKSRHSD